MASCNVSRCCVGPLTAAPSLLTAPSPLEPTGPPSDPTGILVRRLCERNAWLLQPGHAQRLAPPFMLAFPGSINTIQSAMSSLPPCTHRNAQCQVLPIAYPDLPPSNRCVCMHYQPGVLPRGASGNSCRTSPARDARMSRAGPLMLPRLELSLSISQPFPYSPDLCQVSVMPVRSSKRT